LVLPSAHIERTEIDAEEPKTIDQWKVSLAPSFGVAYVKIQSD